MSWLRRLFGGGGEKLPHAHPAPPTPGGHHERLSAWLAQRDRRDEDQLKPLLLDIAAACDAAEEAGVVSLEAAQILKAGLSHRSRLIWGNTVDMLYSLEGFAPAVSALYAELAGSPSATARFAAICCLSTRTPEPLVDVMLAGGLTDRSSEVRWKSGQVALNMNRQGLVPTMTKALADEKSEKARSSLEMSLALLRDGYQLRMNDDDWNLLTVPMRDGGISSLGVSQADLDRRGVLALAHDLRNGLL